MIEPPIFLEKSYVALAYLHYPSTYQIKLCQIECSESIEIYINDNFSITDLVNVLSDKLSKYAQIEQSNNNLIVNFNENVKIISNYNIFKQNGKTIEVNFGKKQKLNLVSNFYIHDDCVKDIWIK